MASTRAADGESPLTTTSNTIHDNPPSTSTSAVEMRELQQPPENPETATSATNPTSTITDTETTSTAERASTSADPKPAAPSTDNDPLTDSHVPSDTALTPPQPVRKESEALGPATDASLIPSTTASADLTVTIQLTTGARHPYKIDERYLTNRKVEAVTAEGVFEPRELSGYKLKELIWTDWRSEWEPRPASPSSIRLIFMGKRLEDNKRLKDYAFVADHPNIIHMTVRPADFDDEETAAKGGKSNSIRVRDGEERSAGCRCVIL